MNQRGINSGPINSDWEYLIFGFLIRKITSEGIVAGATGSLTLASPCRALPFSRLGMFAEAAVFVTKHQIPSFIFLTLNLQNI